MSANQLRNNFQAAQTAERVAWNKWKAQPNSTTYAAYKTASDATGKAIAAMYRGDNDKPGC